MANTCWNCFQTKPDGGVCPFCGYDHGDAEKKHPLALKAGAILNGRYTVGRVLGQGGFGITYIAQDYQTKERVAIKEYFPSEFAGRNWQTATVQVHSEEQRENFAYGKAQFLEEAKTLAAFNGDAHIVRIYSYFEENNTAYFVMEYVDGASLDKYMAQNGGRLSVDEANRLLLPLMESLEKVHARGIIHRDIAPDNILITKDGNAKLIDFGAARYSTGEKSRSLDVILKHGFAPPEQYMRRGRQGPYTDIYALAATYYYAITGKVLPDAVERMQEDTMFLPGTLGVRITGRQEEALLKAMEVNAADRYQSMADFRRAMTAAAGGVSRTVSGKHAAAERPAQAETISDSPKRTKAPGKKKSAGGWIGLLALLLIAAAALLFFRGRLLGKQGESAEPVQQELNDPLTSADSASVPGSPMPGDVVAFGRYEQDGNPENGPEPIEWIVLDVKDGEDLLLSKDVLDWRVYDSEEGTRSWELADLRIWLNDEFLLKAFSEEEREAALNSIQNDGGAEQTEDLIFLLNGGEINRYLPDKQDRVAFASVYAKAQGARVWPDGSCAWWTSSSQYILNDGTNSLPAVNLHPEQLGVRPAVRLDLSAEGLLQFVKSEGKGTETDSLQNTEEPGSIRTIGSLVRFGQYEQDGNQDNGREPIEWLVLDEQDGKCLLISRFGLDCQTYNAGRESVRWEDCSLRSWLNSTFYNEAFDAKEKGEILLTTVDNSAAQGIPGFKTSGGSDTQDRIFLLSYAEAERCFDSNEERSARPTPHAVAEGVYTDRTECCVWWLRSPGYDQNRAAEVGTDGSLGNHGYVDNGLRAVRPVIWVNSKFFESSAYDTVSAESETESRTEISSDSLAFKTVIFGQYEQDNNLENGPEPIEWIVLDEQEGKSLLLSRFGLDSQRYHESKESISWENSTLRNWLNSVFYQGAFSTEDQNLILLTSVDNSSAQGNPEWKTVGRNTQDRIFLLSWAEAETYFHSAEERKTERTAFAQANGVSTDFEGYCWWWLRSSGQYQNTAALIANGGVPGQQTVNRSVYAVRPAMWVKTD